MPRFQRGRSIPVQWYTLSLLFIAKRIEHIPTAEPSRIVIKSVNPIYGDYERPTEEVNIIGRVIWAGKKL